MQIIDSGDGFYKVVDEKQGSYIAQQIFVNRKPKSRIIADIKRSLENLIVERKNLFNNVPYVHFERIEQIDGEYCLLRKGSEIYKPLYLYIKENKVSLEKVKDWIITIAEIAIEAEKHGIVWQGITMNSLWVNEESKLIFLDPDISHELLKYQEMEGIKPLEVYLAPEIIKGVPWNQQSLIYSTGIIFYYLVTGEAPFAITQKSDYSKSDLAYDIINTRPIEPSYWNPRIASPLNDLIMSALEKEAESRIKDWQTFLQMLKESEVNAGKEEEERFRKKAEKVIRVARGKKGLQRFWFKNRKIFFLIIAVILVVSFVNIFNRTDPYITAETSPQQVVKYFYQAINEKNTVLLDETNNLDLKRLDKMIAETYVIERMRTAYDMSDDNVFTIFGVEDLHILLLSEAETIIFKTEYNFFFHEVENDNSGDISSFEPAFIRHDADMSDVLQLEKIDGIWKISNIEGSIVSIIEGRIMELF